VKEQREVFQQTTEGLDRQKSKPKTHKQILIVLIPILVKQLLTQSI